MYICPFFLNQWLYLTLYLSGKATVYPLECASAALESLLKQSANTHPDFSNLLWGGDLGICISNNCQGLSEDHTIREVTVQPMRLCFTTLGYRKLLQCIKSEGVELKPSLILDSACEPISFCLSLYFELVKVKK